MSDLQLPTGWETGEMPTYSGSYLYWRAPLDAEGLHHVWAAPGEVEHGESRMTPDEARTLAARLLEGADVAEKLDARAKAEQSPADWRCVCGHHQMHHYWNTGVDPKGEGPPESFRHCVTRIGAGRCECKQFQPSTTP